jgi:chromosomal replication initiation ATPase DnaA
MSETAQIAFNFAPHPYFGREDFMVSACNNEAVQMIDSWPEWPFFAICLYGPNGCGKTHLSRIFSDKVSVMTHYPYKIPCINAAKINMDTPFKLFKQNPCLIIEDLDENIHQEALFHLYNLYRNEGGNILFTALQAPARMHFSLPDLQSRLNIVPAVAIGEPDDEMLSALILKLFNDRQLIVSPEIITYMLNNMQRSFSYCNKLVEEIDNISLARKRAISIPIVKEAIHTLNNQTQGDLFND